MQSDRMTIIAYRSAVDRRTIYYDDPERDAHYVADIHWVDYIYRRRRKPYMVVLFRTVEDRDQYIDEVASYPADACNPNDRVLNYSNQGRVLLGEEHKA
jgi:hypothetical protein